MSSVSLKNVAKSYGANEVIHGIDLGRISAALIIAIVPICILIAVFQERVVGGLTQGGVKG
jgi:ABC-type glycerol-3-phosphate transport system permease component